ncbi:MAG: TetR/AcrR family transcriptional regulator [Candidatus Bathyarchaeota archaeon]|nr:TetR/AcrR family transcriptional regulator [Candidatus Bathyarchaeota archaeon]
MPKVIPEYKEVARTRIIQAATKVFSEKGYQDTSMEDIAKEIGVTKATLYSYFDSKKDIFNIIAISANQKLRETLHTSLNKRDYVGALEGIVNWKIDLLKEFIHTSIDIVKLSPQDEDISTILRNEREKDLQALREFIQNKIDEKTIRSDVDAYILANIVLALYWEMVTQLFAGFDKNKVHETWSKSMTAIIG